jgi:hypothetical protein
VSGFWCQDIKECENLFFALFQRGTCSYQPVNMPKPRLKTVGANSFAQQADLSACTGYAEVKYFFNANKFVPAIRPQLSRIALFNAGRING